jgi:hypothetical protein
MQLSDSDSGHAGCDRRNIDDRAVPACQHAGIPLALPTALRRVQRSPVGRSCSSVTPDRASLRNRTAVRDRDTSLPVRHPQSPRADGYIEGIGPFVAPKGDGSAAMVPV